MSIGIGAIRTVLPDKLVAVGALPEIPLLDPASADFVAGCGIDTVAVFDAATDAGNAELATIAATRLVRDLPDDPDVLIMVAPRAPDTLLGSDVCHVQAEAKLVGTFAFSVDGLGCTGSSAAWALAGDLLRAQPARESVLIVHASLPAGVDRVRYPVTVIGDGGYAMTMVRGGCPTLKAHRMTTDGTFHDLFRVDYKRSPWYEWIEVCTSPDRYRFELAMHSRLRLSAMVDEVLAEAGLAKDHVGATLMQNVTASSYELLGLPIHPVCRNNLSRYGHLGAMDVVLNLQRFIETGEAGKGEHVLVLNNSPVAAWAASLWEF
jgi:3-oxoacyl-[acyl-carrier-protein] synthase-3